jgi:hypothetical protein
VPRVPAGTSPTPRAPVHASPRAPSAGVPGTGPSAPGLPALPDRSTRPSGSGANLPSTGVAKDAVSGASGAAGLVSGATGGVVGTQGTAASGPNGGGRDSGGYGAAGSGGEAASLQTATVAPLPRLLAYVWPAVALGPAGDLLASLQARFEAAALLPLSASDVSRVLVGLSEAAEEGGLADAAALADRAAVSSPPPASDSKGIWVPDGAEISLLVLIASCAALMTLLAFTIRRELHSRMHRRPF